MSGFALCCWHCREQSPPSPSSVGADLNAMAAGWKLGLDSNGQAHYSCPGCAPLLTNNHDHEPNGWWKAGRVPYRYGRVSGSAQLLHELKTGAWAGSAGTGGVQEKRNG